MNKHKIIRKEKILLIIAIAMIVILICGYCALKLSTTVTKTTHLVSTISHQSPLAQKAGLGFAVSACDSSVGPGVVYGPAGYYTPRCSPAAGSACSSGSNECSQTNSGSIDCGGSCNAADPTNSECPPPEITCTGSSATPGGPVSYIVKQGDTVTIACDSTPATTCEITSSNGLDEMLSSVVSYVTPPTIYTTDYTLSCWTEGKHGVGPKTSKRIRVSLNPGFKEI